MSLPGRIKTVLDRTPEVEKQKKEIDRLFPVGKSKSYRERVFRIIREHNCPTLNQELDHIGDLERIDKQRAEREKGWLERARVALGGKPKFRSRYPARFADVLANHGCPALIRELKRFKDERMVAWFEQRENKRRQEEDEERRKVYGIREVRREGRTLLPDLPDLPDEVDLWMNAYQFVGAVGILLVVFIEAAALTWFFPHSIWSWLILVAVLVVVWFLLPYVGGLANGVLDLRKERKAWLERAKEVHDHLRTCDECQPDYRHARITRLNVAVGHVLRLTYQRREAHRTLKARLALIEANPFSLRQPSGYISIGIGGPQVRALQPRSSQGRAKTTDGGVERK